MVVFGLVKAVAIGDNMKVNRYFPIQDYNSTNQGEKMDIQSVVDKLNELLAIDKEALQKLISCRVEFNENLASEDIDFIVGPDMKMGVLGLINGLIGGDSKIAAQFEKSESGELRLVEFCFINENLAERVNDVKNK